MNLCNALRIQPADCIAFTGAGGKSTAIFQLAREIAAISEDRHLPVVVTATTHLHVDQTLLADSHFICTNEDSLFEIINSLRSVILVTGPQDGERTSGVNPLILLRLHEICLQKKIHLLIEADGSRMHPIKAPGEHEPVIPSFANIVVVVAGMQGLGKPLSAQVVHRPENFSLLTGLSYGDRITPDSLVRLLLSSEGGVKGIPVTARRVALLNQADTAELQSQAKEMSASLLSGFGSVVVASLNRSFIHAVREPIAGILLAAGEAKRFGASKQLLDWHGKPFVRHIAETALVSNLAQVIVVTGSNRLAIENAVGDLPVLLCHNPDWESGQSSSLRAGLRSIKQGIGGIIFLLADQPFVTAAVLDALVENHAADLPPIIAPLVRGQRANPVLFDKVTFQDLSSISGDAGGRMLFSKFPVTFLPWDDSNLLTDVDYPEDYERITNEP